MYFNLEQIKKIIPHREPFLFVDEILEFEPEKRAVGKKILSGEEYFFSGHFPDKPVMPGVLLIEAMAQVGGIIIKQMKFSHGLTAVIAAVDNFKFRAIVRPGDKLLITAELVYLKGKFGKMKAKTEVNGKIAAEGEILFSLVD